MHKRVLEIVTFAISIGTEFIENEAENVKKNDCETKMLKRFAERLKKNTCALHGYLRKPVVYGLYMSCHLVFSFWHCLHSYFRFVSSHT